MKPLIVRANLFSGFVSKFPWSPSLDGILAYQYRLNELGIDAFIETKPHLNAQKAVVEGLPLAIERHGEDWWYQCSKPLYHQIAQVSRHYHRRFNALEAETYLDGKKTEIETTKGPFKNARLIANHRLTNAVEWHCVGDKEEIEKLLSLVTHIGARVGVGFGRVRSWDVIDGGDEKKARFLRPIPAEFAALRGVEGLKMMWAIRPPLQLPEHQRLCVIPDELP
jgi:CRISPR type IV-associated protein Csf3